MKKLVVTLLASLALLAAFAPLASANSETRFIARYAVNHHPEDCHRLHYSVSELGYRTAEQFFAIGYGHANAGGIFHDVVSVCQSRGMWTR
jgi:hypothetical protein